MHKCQGLTLDGVVLTPLRGGRRTGLNGGARGPRAALYVALSRARTARGVRLLEPLKDEGERACRTHVLVLARRAEFSYFAPGAALVGEQQRLLTLDAETSAKVARGQL